MWSYYYRGLFSLVVMATLSTVLTSQSPLYVKCSFGELYQRNTTVKINGTLTPEFSNARSCLVEPNITSAIIRVTLEGLNMSSDVRALYSVVLENLNVLFVGEAFNLSNKQQYHFHVCPSEQSRTNSLDVLFFGKPVNESFAVEIDLDDSVLDLGEKEDMSVPSYGLAIVKAFDIKEEHLSSLIQITVSSEEPDIECLLVVSQSCLWAQNQGLAKVQSSKESLQLTFTKSGRITLSQFSLPRIAKGRWYIGIRRKTIDVEGPSVNKNKEVSVTVTKGIMPSKIRPTLYMCLIAIFGGIAIAAFAHFYLNSDFDHCKPPYHLEEANERNRLPSRGIVGYVPEPIPRLTFPLKQWVRVIFVAWFGRGIKTYPYLTGVLAISFMVGSAQFVIARWSNMIKVGDRDLCYYNELCYRPVAIADMPSNFMLSNVPYVIHGIFLALSFSFREAIAFEASQSENRYNLQNAGRKRFVPYDYSIAYALSWALVFEGLFSATYHLCPSRLTFQFDTAFMFIISGLVVIALYNCRVRSLNYIETQGNTTKPPSETTIQAPKYFLFFVAPLLVFNYVGSIRDTTGLLPFFEVCYWIALVLWLTLMYFWTFQKVGVPCYWKWCGEDDNCHSVEAIVKWAWLLMFPLCLLVIGFKQEKDWSQFFLFSCVAAVALSILGLLSFDTALTLKRQSTSSNGDFWGGIKQFCHPSWICKLLWRNWHRVLYMIGTFLFWVFAMYFFKIKSTTRKVEAPSYSRTKNEEGVLWDFFDYHDIWHMLSSFALFMSGYLLIYVTRKVEIYFWVATTYWMDREKGRQTEANGYEGSGEEIQNVVIHPTQDDDILLEGKKDENGINLEQKRPLNNVLERYAAHTNDYANISYV